MYEINGIWYPEASNSSRSFTPVTPTAASVGSRVGQIAMPDPYGDLSRVFPELGSANASVGRNLTAQLGGQLSPGTVNAIQNYAATRGISGGMPGANIFQNLGARSIGSSAEEQTQRGMQNYGSLLPVISGTQTVNPALRTQINETNAINAAAPDPTAAASYAQELYKQYLDAMSSQSPAGGSRGYSMQMPQTFAGGTRSSSGGTGAYGGQPFYGQGNYSQTYRQSPYTVYSMGGFGGMNFGGGDAGYNDVYDPFSGGGGGGGGYDWNNDLYSQYAGMA